MERDLKDYNVDTTIYITDASMYCEWLREKKQLSENSIRTYSASIQSFLIRKPNLSTVDDYNQYLIEKGIKGRCYHTYYAIKNFIDYKIGDKDLRRDIKSKLIKLKMRKDRVRMTKNLSDEEVLQVINCLKEERHRIIAIIQSLTGIRVGDVLRLKFEDIIPEDYDGHPVIKVNALAKGDKRNVVFIHDDIAQSLIINFIVKDNGAILENYPFMTYGGIARLSSIDNFINKRYRYSYKMYYNDLMNSLILSGLGPKDFASHDFRRGFARKVWEKYKDIHILKNLMHHENVDTTIRYLQGSGLENIEYYREMQK